MKALILIFTFSLFAQFGNAQDPVQWKFTFKHLDGNQYEIRITAVIQGKWHLYSQFTPEGGPLPTKVVFAKNPLVVFEGAVKEEGRLHVEHEEVFDMQVKYFEGLVVFRQRVRLKKKIKPKVAGVLEYMVCDDTKCLPPQTVSYSIPLQ